MPAWIESLIVVHGEVGVLVLLAGVAALLLPKRGAHRWAGRVTLVGMVLAIGLSLPAIVERRNVFLVGMGLIVLGHGAVAWWAAARRPSQPPAGAGRAAVVLLGLIYLLFAAWGALVAAMGSGMGVVVVVMGGIGLLLVRRVWTHRGSWVGLHVHGAAGAFISAVTAFSAATGPRLLPEVPAVALWLLPSAALTPLFVWMGRRTRAG